VSGESSRRTSSNSSLFRLTSAGVMAGGAGLPGAAGAGAGAVPARPLSRAGQSWDSSPLFGQICRLDFGTEHETPRSPTLVDAEGQATKVAAISVLLEGDGASASAILQHLKIAEVVHLHYASRACHEFCRSSATRKLIVPTFFHSHRRAAMIHLPSVEFMYADEAKLSSFGLNEDFARCLEECASLRQLYCSHNPKLVVTHFARALPSLQKLVVVDLSHNCLAVDDHRTFYKAQPLGPLLVSLSPCLRVLDLSYNLLQDEHAFQLVEALEACMDNGACGLRELSLRSNLLGNSSGFALAQLMKGPAGAQLWKLDLRTNAMEAEGACAMLSALQIHPRMKEMRVGYNKQNQRQDLQTARLASVLLRKALSANSHNQLELLDLNNVRVGDDGLIQMAVALGVNTLLRRLDLAFNSIGPDGAEAMARALASNQGLQELDLRDNEIGDGGAQALAEGLLTNYSLRKLQVARNGIGSRGALALQAAQRKNGDLARWAVEGGSCRSPSTRPPSIAAMWTRELHVEFGASGVGTHRLQTMMSRNPSMAVLNFTREAERDSLWGASGGSSGSGGPNGGMQHLSNLFA